MRVITAILAFVGFLVVLLFTAAIGLFAYDEIRRRLVGDEFAPNPPPPEDTGA